MKIARLLLKQIDHLICTHPLVLGSVTVSVTLINLALDNSNQGGDWLSRTLGHLAAGSMTGSAALLVVLLIILHNKRNNYRSHKPPRNARFLVMLLRPWKDSTAFLGDLEEGFHAIARDADQGLRRAHIWYWKEVLLSLWPILRRLIGRLVRLAALYEAFRRILK